MTPDLPEVSLIESCGDLVAELVVWLTTQELSYRIRRGPAVLYAEGEGFHFVADARRAALQELEWWGQSPSCSLCDGTGFVGHETCIVCGGEGVQP